MLSIAAVQTVILQNPQAYLLSSFLPKFGNVL